MILEPTARDLDMEDVMWKMIALTTKACWISSIREVINTGEVSFFKTQFPPQVLAWPQKLSSTSLKSFAPPQFKNVKTTIDLCTPYSLGI